MVPARLALFLRPTPLYLRLASLSLVGLALAACSRPEAVTQQEDFGRFLTDHRADLAPVLTQHGNELLSQGGPLLLIWIGRILLLSLAVGWVVDVALAKGFATLFAPRRNRLNSAIFYATGRLVINALLLISLELLLVAAIGHPNLEVIAFTLILSFGLLSAVFQVGWIGYFYRSNLGIAVLFYLTLVVVHGFLTIGVATPAAQLPASDAAVVFMNNTAAPMVESDEKAVRHKLAALQPDRDRDVAEVSQLRGQMADDTQQQATLRQQIDLARQAEPYLFSQIVKLHAHGDLTAARDQFAALVAHDSNDPLTSLVRGQLAQVEADLATQAGAQRKLEAGNLREAQHNRATLLSHTQKGQATLSEIRTALLGKTRTQVSALFGPPSEIASDRWGFSQPMITNPLTDEHSGLAVYFSDGLVQSVDYYYGKGSDQ